MRTLPALCLATLGALPLACTREAQDAPPASSGGIETVVIDVGGMTSGVDCPPRVKRMLSRVAGVESVKVDFETSTATVMVRDGADRDELARALEGQYIGAFRAHAR